MDLIYTDSNMIDIGVLMDYKLDLAFGKDENDLECTITAGNHCCDAGYYLHIEGTEYGGIVDSIEVDTAANKVIYFGRTWHGILGSKVIMPLLPGEVASGGVTIRTEDANGVSLVDKYLVISGDVNDCIGFILKRLGLGDMFETGVRAAGVAVNKFQFDRFTDGYSGLVKMLDSVGMRLAVEYQEGKVIISGTAKYDFTTDEEFDSELVELRLKKKFKAVNHLICLGSGELENRTVIHLYVDEEGNISQEQTQTGLMEYSAIYDFPAVESDEELIQKGTERLKELWEPDDLIIDLDDTSDFYNVGDKVGAADNVTGLSGSGTINKKIVTIENGQITISYKVGE